MMTRAGEKWRGLLKGEKEGYNERIENDQLEKDFWKKFIEDNRAVEDEYAKHIKEAVLLRLKELECKSALEMGSGWGNYSFDIARETETLTCLDISGDLLNFILEKAKEKNIDNIDTINCKIEDAKLGEYDFVFGYNCFYRIKNIEECLAKLVDSCRGLAVVGMNSRLDREPTLEIERSLNLDVKKHRLSHKAMNEVLEEMGMETETKDMIITRTYDFDSIGDAINFEKSFILSDMCGLEKETEDKIKEIIEKHYKYDGKKYSYRHEILAGLIFIDKRK